MSAGPVLGLFAGTVTEHSNGCWSTTLGWNNGNGYRRIVRNGRKVYLHRLSYEVHVGPIPADLVIDHTCRHRWCIAPNHLEAVTNEENIARGDLPVLAEYSPCEHGVSHWKAKCPPCRKLYRIAIGETKSDRGPAGERTTCPRGHPYDEENTYVAITKKGYRNRMCRICMRERRARAKEVTP